MFDYWKVLFYCKFTCNALLSVLIVSRDMQTEKVFLLWKEWKEWSAGWSVQWVTNNNTMSTYNVRFKTISNNVRNTTNQSDVQSSENIKQNLEDYRRKIRFKQVKFSIIVMAWQAGILVLRFGEYNKNYYCS